MAAATPGTSGKLEVRRTIAAPRERVFEAFADQEKMDRWMCRDAASHIIKYLQFDFRVGGGFILDIAHRKAISISTTPPTSKLSARKKSPSPGTSSTPTLPATKQCSIPQTPSSPWNYLSAENQRRSC